MKKYIKYNWILLITLVVISSLSCKKKNAKDPYADIKGHYFSIRQFGLDQWNTFAGDAFVIVKTVRVGNGKPDSSYTNSDTINWAPIFRTFFETDISDRKYLGQYTYNEVEDNSDNTRNLLYEAKDEDLFTKKLLITIDQHTNMVMGIYIETIDHSFWEDCIQKLYYRPMHTIQMQSDCKPRFGSRKFTVVQYDFMR